MVGECIYPLMHDAALIGTQDQAKGVAWPGAKGFLGTYRASACLWEG